MGFWNLVLNKPGSAAADDLPPEPPSKSWAEREPGWIAKSNVKIAAMKTVEEVADYVSQNYLPKDAAHGREVVRAGLIQIADIIREEAREPRPGAGT